MCSTSDSIPNTNSSLHYEKITYYFGSFLLIVLPNHDIVNWLVSNTYFSIWKQVLALISAALTILILSKKRSLRNNNTKNLRLLLLVLLFMAITLSLVAFLYGFSSYRITYGVISYIGFIGALGFITTSMTLGKILLTLRLSALLGIISSFGLIIDYSTGYLDFLPKSQEMTAFEQLDSNDLRRASFLFGASTIIFPFISFTIFSSIILFIKSQKKHDGIYLLTLVFLSPIAIFLTGSRSQLILVIFFLCISLFIIIKKLLKLRFILLFFISSVILIQFTIKEFMQINQSTMLSERYLNSFNQTDDRVLLWKDSVALLYRPESIFGIGIGSSLGMVKDGHVETSHYESSFFQALSEGGYLGILLRFLPLILGLLFLLKSRKTNKIIRKLMILWFITYFISVFTAPTAAAYHTQYVYFIMVALAIKNKLFFEKINQ